MLCALAFSAALPAAQSAATTGATSVNVTPNVVVLTDRSAFVAVIVSLMMLHPDHLSVHVPVVRAKRQVREGLEGVRGDACFEGIRPCFCRPCLGGLTALKPPGGSALNQITSPSWSALDC